MQNLRNKLSHLATPYKGLKKEIYIIFIARIINAFGALVFPFMTLILTKRIGLTEGEAGLYIAVSGLMFIPASLLGGKLSDVMGRKKLIVIFETLAIIGYGSCAFLEPNFYMVFLLLLSGLFFGIAGPSHDAITGDLTTAEQRQGAYSLNYLGFNLGFAIAQLFAGYLFAHHLRLMFIIDAVTALIGVLLIGLFVKETYDPNAVEETVNITNESEKTVKGSIVKVLFNRPILIYFALASFGYKFVYAQWSFIMPMHTVNNFGEEVGAPLYGMLGSFNATIVVVFTAVLTAAFAKKSNIRRVIYAGILFAVGFGMLGFVSTKIAFFISVMIFTIGEILEAISSMPFIMNHTPASHRGRMSSVIPIIMGAGFSIGPLIMGEVLERTSYEVVWRIAGSIVLFSTFLMVMLERYDLRHQNHQVGQEEVLSVGN